MTVIPRQGRRQRNGPRRLHRAGAGPFAGDLEQHLPGRVRDDLVAEIVAGGCLGDSHEGCCRTDLPGDQLTGTLPVEVHAGRGELLREHVDLAVGSRAPGQVARLPSSRYGARLHPERPVAVTRRSSARYRHWPSRCYFCRQLHLMRTRDDVRIVAAEGVNPRADQREVAGGAYVDHSG